MAREINLYIVRHGQTEANVDHELYKTKADHAVRLTSLGVEQAHAAGVFLAKHLDAEKKKNPLFFGRTRVWYSPYYRARETAVHIVSELGTVFDKANKKLTYRENLFLFEQKAGLFDGLEVDGYKELFPTEAADYAKHVRYNGRSFAKSPLGESRIDIAIRCKHFFVSILNDFRRQNIRNVVVVCHGVTARAITGSWMNYPFEWLEAEKNPGNCWIRHIHGGGRKGYTDEGYIFGFGAPLRQPMATQQLLKNADEIYLPKPERPNAIIPPGVIPVDPYKL